MCSLSLSLSLSFSLLDCTLFIAFTFSSVRVRVCIAKRVFKNKYNSISALQKREQQLN